MDRKQFEALGMTEEQIEAVFAYQAQAAATANVSAASNSLIAKLFPAGVGSSVPALKITGGYVLQAPDGTQHIFDAHKKYMMFTQRGHTVEIDEANKCLMYLAFDAAKYAAWSAKNAAYHKEHGAEARKKQAAEIAALKAELEALRKAI